MRNVWVQVDTGVLKRNLTALRQPLRSGVELVLDLKSNAYGHGVQTVAKIAWQAGVKSFLVGTIAEGKDLREAFPTARLLIAEPVDDDATDALLDHELFPVISNESHARAIARRAADRLEAVRCHVLVDTGLGQFGFFWKDAARELPRLGRTAGLKIVGLCTQLVRTEPRDAALIGAQMSRFEQVVAACTEKGMRNLFRHASDSLLLLPQDRGSLDGARPGLMLYGYAPGSSLESTVRTKPCLRWCTHIAQIRRVPANFPVGHGQGYRTQTETHLATLPVGYANGYPVRMANAGSVVVAGRRRPVVGTVDAHVMSIDLGEATDLSEGQTITLIGRDGEEAVWADEIARICGMDVHEVLSSIR